MKDAKINDIVQFEGRKWIVKEVRPVYGNTMGSYLVGGKIVKYHNLSLEELNGKAIASVSENRVAFLGRIR